MAHNDLSWTVSDDEVSNDGDDENNNIDIIIDKDHNNNNNNIYIGEEEMGKSKSPLRVDIQPGNTVDSKPRLTLPHSAVPGGAVPSSSPFPSSQTTALPIVGPPPPPPVAAYFSGNFQQQQHHHMMMMMPPPLPPPTYYHQTLTPTMQQQYFNHLHNNQAAGSMNAGAQQPYASPHQQQHPTTTLHHSIVADSPISESGENELEASTRYVSKWSPSLFNTSISSDRKATTLISPLPMQYQDNNNNKKKKETVGSKSKESSVIFLPQQTIGDADAISSMESYYQAEIERLKSQLETKSRSSNLKESANRIILDNSIDSENLLETSIPMAAATDHQINQLESEIRFLQEEQENKYILYEKEKNNLQHLLDESRQTIANLKAAAAEETEESSIKNRNNMEKLEDTFRKREENLESSMKDQGIALQKALANEATVQAAFNSLKLEKDKLENEVNKWSSLTNRFRMERDDLAEQNTELKRQLNLDSTNLSQTEYLNQKLQNEITNYKSILEQNERVLRTAMDKEEILRGSVYKLQEQNKELETVILNLRRNYDMNIRNQEMNDNYSFNHSSQMDHQLQHHHQRPLYDAKEQLQQSTQPPRQQANHVSLSPSSINNRKDLKQRSTTNLLYHHEHQASTRKNYQNDNEIGNDNDGKRNNNDMRNAYDRRNNIGGGVMGREFSENNRYNAISPSGNSMVSVLGKKSLRDSSPQQFSNRGKVSAKVATGGKRTNDRIFPSSLINNISATNIISNKNKNTNGTATDNKAIKQNKTIIESSIFPIGSYHIEDSNTDLNHQNKNEEAHRNATDATTTTTLTLKSEKELIEEEAHGAAVKNSKDNTANVNVNIQPSSSIISFQEAMENARRKKAAIASAAIPSGERSSSSFSIPTPRKQAATFAAKQNRPNFKIEDPKSSRVKPIALLTEEDKRQVRLQRVKRAEAAPFATEHSLNLQKKQMSEIENQLIKLGLEKTMLETELMKNESLARKRMDARHKQKRLENRLGEIVMLSSKLRQKLKHVEGR